MASSKICDASIHRFHSIRPMRDLASRHFWLLDFRHQNHCEDIAGKVLQCSKCDLRFTTPEVVNLALERWCQQEAGDAAPISGFPISKARQDMCATRQGYDIANGKLAFYDPNNQQGISTLIEHRCKDDTVREGGADETLQPLPHQDLRDAT